MLPLFVNIASSACAGSAAQDLVSTYKYIQYTAKSLESLSAEVYWLVHEWQRYKLTWRQRQRGPPAMEPLRRSPDSNQKHDDARTT